MSRRARPLKKFVGQAEGTVAIACRSFANSARAARAELPARVPLEGANGVSGPDTAASCDQSTWGSDGVR